jgi:hypothetical protein
MWRLVKQIFRAPKKCHYITDGSQHLDSSNLAELDPASGFFSGSTLNPDSHHQTAPPSSFPALLSFDTAMESPQVPSLIKRFLMVVEELTEQTIYFSHLIQLLDHPTVNDLAYGRDILMGLKKKLAGVHSDLAAMSLNGVFGSRSLAMATAIFGADPANALVKQVKINMLTDVKPLVVARIKVLSTMVQYLESKILAQAEDRVCNE